MEVVARVGVCPRVACPVTAGVTFKIFLFAEEPNVNASVPGINKNFPNTGTNILAIVGYEPFHGFLAKKSIYITFR